MMITPDNIDRSPWQECMMEVRIRLQNAPRILLASDFDGTLSPLVDHPEAACLHPAAPEVLKSLAALHPYVTLAFLSGRRLSDLKNRLPLDPSQIILAGNHGFELSEGQTLWTHPGALATRNQLDLISHALQPLIARFDGTELEDKSASLSLHYRRLSPACITTFRQEVLKMKIPASIKLHEGNSVIEYRPNIHWNKGTSLRHIMNHHGFGDDQTLYLGDDLTDEDIFENLSERAITVHVGSPTKHSAAWLNAREPADAVHFLQEVLCIIRDHHLKNRI